MRIKETKVYPFSELSEEAQEKALESLSDINASHDWYEYTLEEWKEKLSAAGFESADIQFSGFWSQGDGACFDARVDVEKALNTILFCNKTIDPKMSTWLRLAELERLSARIEKIGHHYVHENARRLYLRDDMDEKQARLAGIDALEACLEELRLDFCQAIYSALEEEYEYLTSREKIVETIEANEYEFTEDGRLA